jgi:predicted nucleotidyltransferase component of viral defense system
MKVETLKPFALVGGTNLSLRFGHRISEDLDLFANEAYESEDITRSLLDLFPGEITIVEQRTHTLLMYIQTVKVDIVLHRYPYLQPIETVEGIRLASVPDIIAMKLNAITRRSTKKDFFDIAELLEHYSLQEMLQFFTDKYAATDIGFVVRSLTYFEGAETSKDPILLRKWDWKQVKQIIQQAVQVFWRG